MKCIALVVGIDHYNDVDNYPELHTAVSDANAVAEVLHETPGHETPGQVPVW